MFYCATIKTTALNLQQHAVVNITNVTSRKSFSVVDIEIINKSVADCYISEQIQHQFNREEIGTSVQLLQ